MKKQILTGLIFGSIAGIIDVVPMVMQGLSTDANISAFSLWVISGFLIATSSLEIHPIIKGVFIAFLVLIPALILIAWQDPFSLIPITIMTVILGSILGYSINKVNM